MRLTGRPLKLLFLAALVSILGLLIASDFSPPNVAGFRGAQTTDKEVEVRCLALECNETIKGIVLNLLDTEGAEVRAFCPKGSFDEEPSAGSIIDIVCQPSMDDRTFFISSIEVVH